MNAFQEKQLLNAIKEMAANPEEEPEGIRLNPISDRDAEHWLRRAREAADRRDWKLAADTLIRVIDQFGDRTVSTDDTPGVPGGTRYYSAAHLAREQIRQWSDEGLNTFRLLYDVEAQQLFDQAVQEHNLDPLRLVMRKFLLTTPGPRAGELLATWLLDLGQGGEAIDILTQLDDIPNSGIPVWRLRSELCLAYALSEDATEAKRILRQLQTLDKGASSSLPPDWPRRLEAIARFVDSEKTPSPVAGTTPSSSAWPVMLGPSTSAGRMPAVEPAVTPDEQLRSYLPGAERLDTRLVQGLIKRTGRPPVWQAVSDGKSLFITCPEGLIARDLATFDLLWRIVPRIQRRSQSLQQFRTQTGTAADNSERLDELTTRTLWHDYRGTVSTALGLVFFIEQSVPVGEQFPTKKGVLPANDLSPTAEPNSLRAFEADTGRALWTRGRGGPSDDELKLAHFFSTPVLSAGKLIAPFQLGEDIFLAVLDKQGKLIRKIVLGSGVAGMFPMNGVLQPTICGGAIYLQTGAGLLIALNEHDYSLRWLAPYDRGNTTVRSGRRQAVWAGVPVSISQPDEWVSTPPLVVGGLVVVAPFDGGALHAFARKDGKEQWSFPRGSHRYLIGADAQRVFVAGKHITALDLRNGAAVWSYSEQFPTGRVALCGDSLLVPTANGLVRLDAATGIPKGELLASGSPLGNLLVADGSLYSIATDAISKFPDIDQSQRLAEKALAQNPTSIHSLMRLAWLATLRHQWNEALALLDRADKALEKGAAIEDVVREAAAAATTDPTSAETLPPTRVSSADLRQRIVRQRVAVLIHLASETTADQRGKLLEQAFTISRHPIDLVTSGLAFCEFLAQQQDHVAAFQRGLELLRLAGTEPIQLESQHSGRAAVLVRERLTSLWREMKPADRSQALDSAGSLIESIRQDGDARVLATVADVLDIDDGADASTSAADAANSNSLTELAATIDESLGYNAASILDTETAVYYWERAASRNPNGKAGLKALAQLARCYSGGIDGLPTNRRELARIVTVLRTLPANTVLPISTVDGPPGSTRHQSVGDLISEIESQLPHVEGRAVSLTESPDPDTWPRVLHRYPRLRRVWSDLVPLSFFLRDADSTWDPENAPNILTDLIPIRMLKRIVGISVRSRSATTGLSDSEIEQRDPPIRWIADLNNSMDDEALAAGRVPYATPLPLAVAGRVGIVFAGSQICAIGLDTGRMLWPSIPIEDITDAPDPAPRNNDRTAGAAGSLALVPEPPVLAIDGLAIIATSTTTIMAIPARADAVPLWQRHFTGRPIGRMSVVRGHAGDPRPVLALIDQAAENVYIIDPRSGRIRRQYGILPQSTPTDSSVQKAVRDIIDRAQENAASPPQEAVDDQTVIDTDSSLSPAASDSNAIQFVARVGSAVCRGAGQSIVARDVLTGRVLWSQRTGTVKGVFALEPRHVGVACNGDRLIVLDVETGRAILDKTCSGIVLPPLDATMDWTAGPLAMDGARVLLFTRTIPAGSSGFRYILSSIPLTDSAAPWQRDLGRLATVSPQMLRASPHWIAAVTYDFPKENRQQQNFSRLRVRGEQPDKAFLHIFGKAEDARLIERPFRFDFKTPPEGNPRSGLLTDVFILDQQIIAVGPDGYHVLESE